MADVEYIVQQVKKAWSDRVVFHPDGYLFHTPHEVRDGGSTDQLIHLAVEKTLELGGPEHVEREGSWGG